MDLKREAESLRRRTPRELRRKYCEVFGRPPKSGNKDFLWRRIIWGLQASEHGGLSEGAARRAEEIAMDEELQSRLPYGLSWALNAGAAGTTAAPFSPRRDRRLPMPGSLITREYKGQVLRVMVLDDGFEWNGRVYRSLTALTKEITGAHWNGYGFWGLA